jgi:hypothetical protein
VAAVRVNCIPNVTAETIQAEVRTFVDAGAQLVQVAAEFHDGANQSLAAGPARPAFTRRASKAWAVAKRQAPHGTHHKFSQQYLPLYLGEICFRLNHRGDADLFLSVLENALTSDREVA